MMFHSIFFFCSFINAGGLHSRFKTKMKKDVIQNSIRILYEANVKLDIEYMPVKDVIHVLTLIHNHLSPFAQRDKNIQILTESINNQILSKQILNPRIEFLINHPELEKRFINDYLKSVCKTLIEISKIPKMNFQILETIIKISNEIEKIVFKNN